MSAPLSLLSMHVEYPFVHGVGPATMPLSVAFSAGVLSTLNPCGFALLPAYVSYTVKQHVSAAADRQPSSWRQLLRAGLLGLPLAAGFVLVFVVAAGVLALGGRLLVQLFPWLALVVGVGLVFLGGWSLLTRRELTFPWIPALPKLPRRGASAAKTSDVQPGGRRTPEGPQMAVTLRAAWIFGLGYGLSSLGCALPIFLVVVGTAITAGGVGVTLLVLASYAAGMAAVLLAVAMAATTVGDLLRLGVFPLLRWVQPVAALLFIAAGSYIIVYQVRGGLW
jgi:cytochrome c-type biogenesis protein